jgi:hypothetical protein
MCGYAVLYDPFKEKTCQGKTLTRPAFLAIFVEIGVIRAGLKSNQK